MAFVGDPPLPFFRPLRKEIDEVHISVAFTWDIEEGYRLKEAWAQHYDLVRIGGPALRPNTGGFVPGMYLRKGVTITSRGCIRSCPWCAVPVWEGRIKTISIRPGWIVQDNNLLACPRAHQEAVFEMLRQQPRKVSFPGGLDARLLNDWTARQLSTLRIDQIFLAADTEAALKPLAKAAKKLSFLTRRQKRCYVMIGYGGETLDEARKRLRAVWDLGCMPFAALYQPFDGPIKHGPDWKALSRSWSRPAAMIASNQ